MKSTLTLFKTSIVMFFLGLIAISSSQAQVTLRAGSIVPIGWNSLSTTNSIRLGVLQEIPAGSVIYFTDWGWDNPSEDFFPASVSSIGEGQVIWTVASTVPAGTVLLMRLIGSTASPSNVSLSNLTTAASLNSNISFSSYTAGDPISLLGDGFFVFQKNTLGDVFFISGFNNSAGGSSVVDADGWNTAINLSLLDSYLPDGAGSLNALVNSVTAIGMTTASGLRNLDNVQYTGSITETDTTTWRNRLMNIANWTGDNTGTIASTVGTSLSLTAGALPVSLVFFNAVPENNNVLLSWKTASEFNTREFVIEASSDGSSYKDITSVPATGGENGRTYNYIDSETSSATGLLYYRLRIEDFDASKEYSPVALARVQNNQQVKIAAFPNPLLADNKLRLSIQLPSNGLFRLQLTNMSGKVVRTENHQGLKGKNSIEWMDMQTISSGTYLLKISFNNQQQVLKIIK